MDDLPLFLVIKMCFFFYLKHFYKIIKMKTSNKNKCMWLFIQTLTYIYIVNGEKDQMRLRFCCFVCILFIQLLYVFTRCLTMFSEKPMGAVTWILCTTLKKSRNLNLLRNETWSHYQNKKARNSQLYLHNFLCTWIN